MIRGFIAIGIFSLFLFTCLAPIIGLVPPFSLLMPIILPLTASSLCIACFLLYTFNILGFFGIVF